MNLSLQPNNFGVKFVYQITSSALLILLFHSYVRQELSANDGNYYINANEQSAIELFITVNFNAYVVNEKLR